MRRARGAALIAVIFFIVVMSLLAAVTAFLVVGSSVSAVGYQASEQALFLAEAGIERTLRVLTAPNFDATSADRRRACVALVGDAGLTGVTLGAGAWTLTAGAAQYANNAAAGGTGARLNGGVNATATTLTVNSTAGYAPAGRLMVDREIMDYAGLTPTAFTGVARGVAGTAAAAHADVARVGQYQCNVSVQGAVPGFTAPRGLRTLTVAGQSQEGWAVGAGGVILRFNAPADAPADGVPRWTVFQTTAIPLRGISLDSYAHGWTVGNPPGGGIDVAGLRWNPDGSPNWDVAAVDAATINAVQAISSMDAWAVGDAGAYLGGACDARGRIGYWNGTAWGCAVSPSNQNLNALHMLDMDNDGRADFGWAVGNTGGGNVGGCPANNARILRFNGAWSCATGTTVNENLLGVFTVSATEAWAVGTRGANNGTGWTILRNTGGGWARFGTNTGTTRATDLSAIYMLDTDADGVADFGWAVGRSANNGGACGNTARILNWDGAAWRCVASPVARDLNAVTCNAIDDCWAVGDAGTILHWDGASWRASAQSGVVTTQNLTGIAVVGPRTAPRTAWRESFP